MRSVRRLADSLAIPWRCISKATELQLGRVLEQLCSQPADEAVPGSGQRGDTPACAQPQTSPGQTTPGQPDFSDPTHSS
jgi:hypothetical protein